MLVEKETQASDAIVSVEKCDRLVQVFLTVNRNDHLKPKQTRTRDRRDAGVSHSNCGTVQHYVSHSRRETATGS